MFVCAWARVQAAARRAFNVYSCTLQLCPAPQASRSRGVCILNDTHASRAPQKHPEASVTRRSGLCSATRAERTRRCGDAALLRVRMGRLWNACTWLICRPAAGHELNCIEFSLLLCSRATLQPPSACPVFLLRVSWGQTRGSGTRAKTKSGWKLVRFSACQGGKQHRRT